MNARPRIVVAGGAGFIGAHLCRRLIARGARVLCVDSLLTGTTANLSDLGREPRFEFLQQDVQRPLSARLRPDAVYNLASAASPPHYQADPVHTLMSNVVGTHNLLALAARSRARFLLASTSEVYGDPLVHPQVEGYHGNVNPTGPRACYDEAKRCAETLAFDFRRTQAVDVRVARIFNTYGPFMRCDDGRVVSNFVCQALKGEDITLYGDGRQSRSLCYVSDLVDGLLALMDHEGEVPGPINLGNPAELTVLELATRILALTRSRSRLVEAPLPVDDPKRRRPDIRLAQRLLGWSPQVSLETGLQPTLQWFRSQVRAERALATVERAATA